MCDLWYTPHHDCMRQTFLLQFPLKGIKINYLILLIYSLKWTWWLWEVGWGFLKRLLNTHWAIARFLLPLDFFSSHFKFIWVITIRFKLRVNRTCLTWYVRRSEWEKNYIFNSSQRRYTMNAPSCETYMSVSIIVCDEFV